MNLKYAIPPIFFIVASCSYYYFHKQTLLPKTIEHALIDTLSKSFNTPVQIQSIIQLSEPDRNLVLRIVLKEGTGSMPRTIIFKQFFSEHAAQDDKTFGRFARDWSGLAFITNLPIETPLAPRFYGGNIEHRFIVFEDLGDKYVSLVDALASQDSKHATAALTRFMTSLGKLHASSYGKTNTYLKILHTIYPKAATWTELSQTTYNTMLSAYESVLKKIGIPATPDIEREIQTTIRTLLEPGNFTTLIHGDACPGNTFDYPTQNKLLFIDFEWSFVRNALLDGAYLRMNMPNCWCAGNAGTIPNDIIHSLETLYRKELIKTIPAAKNDTDYYTAYVCACAYWMLKASIIIKDVLDQDNDNVRPRILSNLQAFITVAKQYDKLPHLRLATETILKELHIRWPEVRPMEMFPTYR